MNILFFLSYKFLKSGYKQKNIASIINVSFFTILFSSFILILISSIMEGFENETYNSLKGLNPDIIIKSYNEDIINFKKLKYILNTEFKNYIDNFYIEYTKKTILIINKNQKVYYIPIFLKGVDINYLKFKKLNDFDKDQFYNGNSIIIGDVLSKIYKLKSNDNVKLLYFDDEIDDFSNINNLILESYRLNINGIFKTGIYDIDESICLISLKLFKKIFQDGYSQVNIILKKNVNSYKVIQLLKDRLNLNIFSWQKQYPALISTLKFEKYIMIIILFLITMMASFNIISLLFIYISYKEKDIALLKTLGYNYKNIIYIFTLIGLFISLPAIFIGSLLALITAFIIDYYKIIYLPDIYYIDYLPASININVISILIISLIIISFLTSIYGAYKSNNIDIERVLR